MSPRQAYRYSKVTADAIAAELHRAVSCREPIIQATKRRPLYMAEVLAQALNGLVDIDAEQLVSGA